MLKDRGHFTEHSDGRRHPAEDVPGWQITERREKIQMQSFPTVKQNLGSYIDDGFPILYIYTYEEAKADRYILDAAGRKKVLEWNGADGLVDFKTKVAKNISRDMSLEATLSFLKNGRELDRTLLVIDRKSVV